jgi:hypothetical protein
MHLHSLTDANLLPLPAKPCHFSPGESGLGKTTLITYAMHPHHTLMQIYCLSVCTAGESGLGKTTFINNLVSSYVTTGKTHDGSSTSLADFQVGPLPCCSLLNCCVTFQAPFNAVIAA